MLEIYYLIVQVVIYLSIRVSYVCQYENYYMFMYYFQTLLDSDKRKYYDKYNTIDGYKPPLTKPNTGSAISIDRTKLDNARVTLR